YHVVDRGADGLRKAMVIENGRAHSELIDDVFMAYPVDFAGSDAGHDMRADHVQNHGGQAADLAHLVLFFGSFDGDAHCFRVLVKDMYNGKIITIEPGGGRDVRSRVVVRNRYLWYKSHPLA